jgi:HSP20 family protein
MQSQRDPLEDLTQLRQTVGHLIEDGLGMLTHLPFLPLSRSIPVDIFETRSAYQIDAALPGIDPNDMAVLATETTITIQAPARPRSERREGTYILQERYQGKRERVLTLAKAIDPEQVTSTYQHGVLTVHAPKVNGLKATQIPVQVDRQDGTSGTTPTTR